MLSRDIFFFFTLFQIQCGRDNNAFGFVYFPLCSCVGDIEVAEVAEGGWPGLFLRRVFSSTFFFFF